MSTTQSWPNLTSTTKYGRDLVSRVSQFAVAMLVKHNDGCHLGVPRAAIHCHNGGGRLSTGLHICLQPPSSAYYLLPHLLLTPRSQNELSVHISLHAPSHQCFTSNTSGNTSHLNPNLKAPTSTGTKKFRNGSNICPSLIFSINLCQFWPRCKTCCGLKEVHDKELYFNRQPIWH